MVIAMSSSSSEQAVVAPIAALSARTRRRRALRGPSTTLTRYVLVPLALVGAWQAACSIGIVDSAVMSSPIEVVKAGVRLGREGVLWTDIAVSARRAALGFVFGLVAGVVLGTVAGLWQRAESVVDSPIQILNTVPFLALVPLFILWFGIGEKPKVILIATGSAIPIYLNLVSAIRNVDVRLIEMAQTVGVSRRRLVARVLLPGALPGTLVGMRMALAFSVIGLVAAEQINATSGIGYMMEAARQFMRTDEIFLGLALYALFGVAASAFITLLERVLLSWQPRFSGR